MKNTKTILVSAGGTAGHTLPAIEISKEFIKRKYKIIFITDNRMFDFVNSNISQDYKNIEIFCLKGRGLYKNKVNKNIKSILLLSFALIQSFIKVLIYRPILAYGFGGVITVPPLLICSIFKIPIILHEGNIVVGKANKFLYKYAKILTTFFPSIEGNFSTYKCVGMPVRKSIENIYNKKYEIKNNELINILVTGGSLGAEVMATKITTAISKFPKSLINKISIRQQVRNENLTYVKKLYDNASIKYKLESYIENFSESLNWCHLIICRSGAGTIAENLISGRPAIMIPLPIASDNHQMKNALLIEKIGAGWIINNKDLYDEKKLIKKLKKIIFNKIFLYKASEKAKKSAIRYSTKHLVEIGQTLITGNKQ